MEKRFEDLREGEFFQMEPNWGIKFRKDKIDNGLAKVHRAYDTRTGEHEHCFGIVYPCSPMNQAEIEEEQRDHEMWGRIWADHDRQAANYS